GQGAQGGLWIFRWGIKQCLVHAFSESLGGVAERRELSSGFAGHFKDFETEVPNGWTAPAGRLGRAGKQGGQALAEIGGEGTDSAVGGCAGVAGASRGMECARGGVQDL